MTPSHTAPRALAVDIRQTDTDALIGVALIVPSDRYAVTLANGAGSAEEKKLTDGEWLEIEAWAEAAMPGFRTAAAEAGIGRTRGWRRVCCPRC